ncbi:MAG: D-glycero-beta-D-manno-heptose-7-phosphate kinase [Candidatus Eisenbacteria bacterium]|nr:D-glycero-beta-D-manno-heptose-7-phosphate kinase [Candidatus Eisenbacteria bacterium]
MSGLSRERLSEILDGLPRVRVAVFGDMMLDRYIWGDVSRISPEAPVPVVEVERESVRFGGAANVAENVAALGCPARIVAVAGDDAPGRELVDLLEGRGVDTSGVVRLDERMTTTKTRIIARNQQVVRADRESIGPVGEPASGRILEALRAALERCDVLVVSDYGKGVLTDETLPAGIARARELGLTICVDPKESHFPHYRGVSAITPNQREAGIAAGVRIVDAETLSAVGWKLSEELEADCVVVTRGDEGMSLFIRGGEHVHLPTVAREVYDVTGAGDTVVSVLGAALGAGASMVEAAEIANHAAGIVIREIGTASVTPDEITASFDEHLGES